MILVFVGAGGSAAVDPDQYPTTVEFFKRLPKEITQQPLFTLVREFLMTQKEDGQPIDIEEVLWSLDKLQEYFSLSRATHTIEGWIMAKNRLNQLDGNALPGGSNPLLGGIDNISVNHLTPLRDSINAKVHEFYVKRPDENKLSDWVNLLRHIEGLDPVIEIFTTNYDLVLETAVNRAKIRTTTGREFDGLHTFLNTALWDEPSGPPKYHGRLTKLHGSMDWQRRGNTILCSDLYTGNPQQHSILYPGFKGEPNEEPFIKFHEHLRAVVREAGAAFFIGFAFRDDYINTILSGLRPKTPKYVIDKEDSPPALAFLDGCKHFSNGLTVGAIQDCIKSLAAVIFQELKQHLKP